MNGVPCTTQLTVRVLPLCRAPIELGGRGEMGGGVYVCGARHVFFISADCLNAFSRRRWGVGGGRTRVPGREGGTESEEGGRVGGRRARRYKRCSVFTGKRERDEGRVATV